MGKSILVLASALIGCAAVHSQPPRVAIVAHEPVEWTWAEFPKAIDPALPDVLLEGDSISRNYYPYVVTALRGRANVFLFATSASVGDPALISQLAAYGKLADRRFAVVHFSNGLHNWAISDEAYRNSFPRYLAAIRALAPTAELLWTSTTYVRREEAGGADNRRIDVRNASARSALARSHVGLDDQNALMRGRSDLYQDDIHFGPVGAEIQARQVAATIAALLDHGSR